MRNKQQSPIWKFYRPVCPPKLTLYSMSLFLLQSWPEGFITDVILGWLLKQLTLKHFNSKEDISFKLFKPICSTTLCTDGNYGRSDFLQCLTSEKQIIETIHHVINKGKQDYSSVQKLEVKNFPLLTHTRGDYEMWRQFQIALTWYISPLRIRCVKCSIYTAWVVRKGLKSWQSRNLQQHIRLDCHLKESVPQQQRFK